MAEDAQGAAGDPAAGQEQQGNAGGGEKPWYDGVDAEIAGHIQNRGWDKLTPVEVAKAAAQAHKEAERFIGARADQLLRIADPTDEAAYRAMWGRLGAPGEASKYDLSAIKTAKGEAIDPNFVSVLQAAYDQNHIPLTAAQSITTALARFADKASADDAGENLAATEASKASLRKEWGQSHDANMTVARSAAEKLGVDAKTIDALSNQTGYDGVMKMFLKIGESMGEASFIRNGPNSDIVINSREKAIARKAELMADQDWVKRYQAGGMNSREFREMTYLTQVIVDGDPNDIGFNF